MLSALSHFAHDALKRVSLSHLCKYYAEAYLYTAFGDCPAGLVPIFEECKRNMPKVLFINNLLRRTIYNISESLDIG